MRFCGATGSNRCCCTTSNARGSRSTCRDLTRWCRFRIRPVVPRRNSPRDSLSTVTRTCWTNGPSSTVPSWKSCSNFTWKTSSVDRTSKASASPPICCHLRGNSNSRPWHGHTRPRS
uniref:(northern house mosquito) hypothetical protein n=1 Tax=Culex pipiens TaxID=7175 RepID=A0A8D8JXG9_CULPI